MAPQQLLECVLNVSEGRDQGVLKSLASSADGFLLDVHHDADHHRSVFTLCGPPEALTEALHRFARAVVAALDMSHHEGVHPRIGALDVVPFVSLERDGPGTPVRNGPPGPAIAARDAFAQWAGTTLGLPCFLYGDLPDGGQRTLPQLRREAWRALRPEQGPDRSHHSAGAAAVGARPLLVAYNVWLDAGDGPAEPGAAPVVAAAREIAAELRQPGLRTLGLAVRGGAQVSANLIEPERIGPAEVYDAVARAAHQRGVTRLRAELVGLVPRRVLDAIPPARWDQLGLSAQVTIEARLTQAGLDGGRFPAY